MTIQELQHIIDIAGTYDTDEPEQWENYFDDVFWPLLDAIESNDNVIVDNLMKRTPEEMFFIHFPVWHATKDSKQAEHIELYNKYLKDDEHIEKVLYALQKQTDEAQETDTEKCTDEYYHIFNISADMAEGVYLSPEQIALWERIIERQHMIVVARKSREAEVR
jgi:hypothetical protein